MVELRRENTAATEPPPTVPSGVAEELVRLRAAVEELHWERDVF